MKIHHIRNATMVIESGDKFILIDPMLGKKGSLPPFTFIRFKPRKNPLLDLPDGSMDLVRKTTHCLITHQHQDHIDPSGEKFLIENKIPVTYSSKDSETLLKKGLNITQTLDYWSPKDMMEGKITGIPAKHGYGFISKPMGNVMGFLIQLPDEPSVYLASDTIYTKDVKKVLTDYSPDICVIPCGTAQLDVFKPLLMNLKDIRKFIQDAPGEVICNHLEALNHCPTTRRKLRDMIYQAGLEFKTWIPEDGEMRSYN